MPSPEMERATRILSEAVLPAEPTMDERREAYDKLSTIFPAAESVAQQEAHLGGVPGLRLAAADAAGDKAILYFHGGGYAMGSIESHGMIVSRLAAASGLPLHFPLYRLAPEHPFPAAIEDCVRAYRGLLDQGLAPEAIAFAGDSAGGGLTVATMLEARDAGLPLPACGYAISPWVDMEGDGTWRAGDPDRDAFLTITELEVFIAAYLGGDNLRHPWVAPVFGELAGLPPILIQASRQELLWDDTRRLAEALEAAGVTVRLETETEAPHVWHHMAPMVPEAVAAIDAGGAFLRARLG